MPGQARNSVARPSRSAIFCHSEAKWPVSNISTASPGVQRVGQRRLPGAGARGRVDDDRMPGLEDLLHAGQHLQPERAELGPAVVDRRQAHRPQDAVGHRARAGDLQEVAAAGVEVEFEHGVAPWSAPVLHAEAGTPTCSMPSAGGPAPACENRPR